MARETLEVWNFQRYSNERQKKNVCKTFLFHHPTKKNGLFEKSQLTSANPTESALPFASSGMCLFNKNIETWQFRNNIKPLRQGDTMATTDLSTSKFLQNHHLSKLLFGQNQFLRFVRPCSPMVKMVLTKKTFLRFVGVVTLSSWWLNQPISKIFVKWDHLPKDLGWKFQKIFEAHAVGFSRAASSEKWLQLCCKTSVWNPTQTIPPNIGCTPLKLNMVHLKIRPWKRRFRLWKPGFLVENGWGPQHHRSQECTLCTTPSASFWLEKTRKDYWKIAWGKARCLKTWHTQPPTANVMKSSIMKC